MSTLDEWWVPYPQAPLRCVTKRNRTLYVQREGGCMNSTHDLVVSLLPFGLLTQDNDIAVIPYPSDGKDIDIRHERFAPSEVEVQFSMGIDKVQRVEVLTMGRIVDANYLVPTECALISYGSPELKILKLSDKSGCVLNSIFSSFQKSFTSTGVTFSASLNLSVFNHLASPRLQCSLVPCGDKCLENGEFCRSVPMSFTNKMLILHRIEDRVLNRALMEKVSLNCQFLRERLFLAVSCFLLLCTTSASWYISNKLISCNNWLMKTSVCCARIRDQIRMFKHKHFHSRTDTTRVQIIHPIDTFNCPPTVTSDSVTSIRRKFSKSIESSKNPSDRTNDFLLTCDSPTAVEHLDVNELQCNISLSSHYICSSLIDSLPDPPRLSVQELVDMHKKMTNTKSKKEDDNLITSKSISKEKYLRSSSLRNKSEQHQNDLLTYASLPPIPPRDSSITLVAPTPTPRSLSSSDPGRGNSRKNETNLHLPKSLPALHSDHIPIEEECEFNTLDRPLAKYISAGLRERLSQSNKSSAVSIRCNELEM